MGVRAHEDLGDIAESRVRAVVDTVSGDENSSDMTLLRKVVALLKGSVFGKVEK